MYFEWYCWRLYVLLLALLFFRLPTVFMCFFPICLFVASLDLTWGWFIDRSIDFGVTVYLDSFGHFFWFCALCPWALWPLRVSVGPSWFCRADFSDGKVQKLGLISTETVWGVWKPPCLETWAKRIDKTRSRNRLTMWYMITFGPNADPSEPWQRILSQERSAPCKLSARSGLQGLKPSPAEFLKPKSM